MTYTFGAVGHWGEGVPAKAGVIITNQGSHSGKINASSLGVGFGCNRFFLGGVFVYLSTMFIVVIGISVLGDNWVSSSPAAEVGRACTAALAINHGPDHPTFLDTLIDHAEEAKRHQYTRQLLAGWLAPNFISRRQSRFVVVVFFLHQRETVGSKQNEYF